MFTTYILMLFQSFVLVLQFPWSCNSYFQNKHL